MTKSPRGRTATRLLIANRGEIAVRIARTCRAMGIHTIAVYSDVDREAPHVRACDEALRIGPPPARESYLNIERVLEAARERRANAIHPGYGFLSENPAFAQACENAGITFVGPSAAAMRAAGNKIAAKKAAERAGVPIVPGYLGSDQSAATLAREAARIGAPLMIKAAAGGGGKGMRLVSDLQQFGESVESAKREARAAFSDDTVFLEKYVADPRHVEVQILADLHGAIVHLNERECSIQRRHQKVLEETPSTAVTPELRARLGDAAIAIAKAVGYTNAGTVEFMLDAGGNFYFLEINARLQVEHPITEAVTGVDLVREQIDVALGQPLRLTQPELAPSGHAIEVRIYAEDPAHGFLPSAGEVLVLAEPTRPGIRVDSGIEQGSVVSEFYDPLLAKLIAYDGTRADCIHRLREALDDYHVLGVTTNLPFLRWLAANAYFARGETTTRFLEQHFKPELLFDDQHVIPTLLAGAAAVALDGRGWRHRFERRSVRFAQPLKAEVTLEFDAASDAWRCRADGSEGQVRRLPDGAFRLTTDGRQQLQFTADESGSGVFVSLGFTREWLLEQPPDVAHADTHGPRAGAAGAIAPMTGTVVKVEVKPGDRVSAHQTLVMMEAMKMEHAIAAPYDGTVATVFVKSGDRVDAGQTLAEVKPL